MDGRGSGSVIEVMGRHRMPVLTLLFGLFFLALSVQAASFEEGLSAYREGNLDLARSTWEAAAEVGDNRSMFSLGSLYMRGKGVPENPASGYKWFFRAAEAGLPQAQYNIAFMLEQGNGVERDTEAALGWYQKAARSGLPQAQAALASRLWDGRGTEADPAAAVRWFEAAALQGHPEAQNNLGTMLENGIGTAANPTQAAKWYERAAMQGVRDAQASLARLYREGRGVEADGDKVEYWTARARGEREDEPPPGSAPTRPAPAVAAAGSETAPKAPKVEMKPVVAAPPPKPKPPAEKKAVTTASAAVAEPPEKKKEVPASSEPAKSATPPVRADVSVSPKKEPRQPAQTAQTKPAPEKPVARTRPEPAKKEERTPPTASASAPAGWLEAAPDKHYTAQLIGSRSPDALEKFVSKNGLGDHAELLQTQRDGRDWYLIVYGEFPSRSAANTALRKLPDAVRKHGGWVRTIGEIRKLLSDN